MAYPCNTQLSDESAGSRIDTNLNRMLARAQTVAVFGSAIAIVYASSRTDVGCDIESSLKRINMTGRKKKGGYTLTPIQCVHRCFERIGGDQGVSAGISLPRRFNIIKTVMFMCLAGSIWRMARQSPSSGRTLAVRFCCDPYLPVSFDFQPTVLFFPFIDAVFHDRVAIS